MKYLSLFAILFYCSLFCNGNNSENITDSKKYASLSSGSEIISSYIRGNFYNRDRISAASMKACNDLIVIGATPNADGSLSFDHFMQHDGTGYTTLESLVAAIHKDIGETVIDLRLGVSGGKHWKTMIADQSACIRFGKDLKTAIEQFDFKGADLDFEWASTTDEFNAYSEALVTIRAILGNNYRLTVAIHPLYYKLSGNAINAVDYAFLQCYGPSPDRFSYDQFISDINKITDYGYPMNQLVVGVPFYGVTADNSKQTVAYSTLVTDGLVTNPSSNETLFNGESFIYNGQDMIHRKTKYALNIGLAGMMCWDLATDVPIDQPFSLLRTLTETVTSF